jgi:hypothetical protein
MMLDSDEYVGVANEPDKEQVATITADNADTDTDQLQDLPVASDCESRYKVTSTVETAVLTPPFASRGHEGAHTFATA